MAYERDAEPMPLDKITRKQFAAYERVRRSGICNMFDGVTVCSVGRISAAAYRGILKNYEALMEKWPEVRDPELKKTKKGD